MKWRGNGHNWGFPDEVEELIHLGIKALRKYLAETSPVSTALSLTIKGTEMNNYQLNAGDSVDVTITDTDAVTGLVVTPDAGSLTAVLSSSTDSVSLDPTGGLGATITAGTTLSTGNTITVNATVNGVASTPAVGTYDVVASVVSPDATNLSVSFGTEAGPNPLVPSPLFSGTHQVNPLTPGFLAADGRFVAADGSGNVVS